MTRLFLLSLSTSVAVVCATAMGRTEEPARSRLPPTPLRQAFEAGVDSLSGALAALDSSLGQLDLADNRVTFRAARRAYKHEEVLLTHYSPTTVSMLNGPAEQENDDDVARPLGERAAFQRIEQRIFHDAPLTRSDRDTLRRDARRMRNAVLHFRSMTTFISIGESDLLEAARNELALVSTLSLAEVDSDESGDAVLESADALDGLRAFVTVAMLDKHSRLSAIRWNDVESNVQVSRDYLRDHSDVDQLDRLTFIAGYAEPLGRAIADARRALPAPLSVRSVWRLTAPTVFARDAFDASAYAPDFAIPSAPPVIALGERLFNDRRLSGPQTRSCASCHIAGRGFADGVPRHSAFVSGSTVARNTPTLLNAALQPALFADGRSATLEDQIAVVLASPEEMASSVDIAAKRLNSDSSYRAAFARATSRASSSITPMSLRAVLATYLRSLVKMDSRFDVAARGNMNALDASERRGFTVFMGRGRCGTCHFAPLFSGAAPPHFATSGPEIIGVPSHADTARATLDADQGRAAVDGIPEHRSAFKVPTLRNVELTAPYMHNGAFATLEQVVDFYDRGGGTGIGAFVPAQTLSAKPLKLTSEEKRNLVSFLKTLTDHDPFP